MKRLSSMLSPVFVLLALASSVSAEIRISEVVASNTYGYIDEYGCHEDWLEIRNSGPDPVDLTGFGLTDDPATPMKWTFPAVLMRPGDHLLVIASGRNVVGTDIHCNFKLSSEGEVLQ